MAENIRYRFNQSLAFVCPSKGNLTINDQFVQEEVIEPIPRTKLLRWMLSPNPKRAEKIADYWKPNVVTGNAFLTDQQEKVVWLGHASFFIKVGQYQILTDPVFYDLAPMLRRRHKLPCSPSDFKNIDYILLSHGHRDHFDIPSLKLLARLNPSCTVLCPLGFDNMLRKIGFIHIQEAAWYQQYQTPDDLKIVFLPAKHWNRRFLWDYNTTLWGSHWIEGNGASVYFAGDTAMDQHFQIIREIMGQPDVCLMPVGAYLPRFVMEWAHIAPWEAVEAFGILGGKRFVPMHYGTFDLSDEPASEPYRLLQQYEREGSFKDSELLLPEVGMTIKI
jgi:L-ascorbate metabolism protein UlaG (beta-lactamase superfamily)